MRIYDGKNPLDSTSVHPESYKIAEKLLEGFGFGKKELSGEKPGSLEKLVKTRGAENLAEELSVGVPTLNDIVAELSKPGRDPRDELPAPLLRTDVLEMKDLKEGMTIKGTVRNVIDFGAFVHISHICDKFIKHPSEVLSVGDVVNVKVLSVDLEKKRISLTMKGVEQ